MALPVHRLRRCQPCCASRVRCLSTSKTLVRPFVLKEQEDPAGGAANFSINGQRWPDITPVEAKSGAVEIWEIEANPEMDHPFHLHGMFFKSCP